jgi:cellulose synthase/poly-beta-1,6-N-acetylglucosamine synthase-like glycosyltransferase
VGYKAGNMLNGMAALSDTDWEYVAVFDADFEMAPDFLYQTVYHMMKDPRLAFVQTRWTFTNGYDNLLCWWVGGPGVRRCGSQGSAC